MAPTRLLARDSAHRPLGTAAVLNPKPKDLTDKTYTTTLKDQYVFDLIQKGGTALGKSPLMPPLGSQLKDGDIRDVIVYVRSLTK